MGASSSSASGGTGEDKELLLERYEELKQEGKDHHGQGELGKASNCFAEAADVLDEVMVRESDELAEKRREVQRKLRKLASQLSQESDLRSGDNVDGIGKGSGEEASDSSKPGSPLGDDDGDGEFQSELPDRDFSDVVGMDEVKERFQRKVIKPLQNPGLYEEYGDLSVEKGVILYGPSGTGKTFFSRALAGELGYSFIDLDSTEITSSYVSRSAENVKKMFESAKKQSPCLVFIDEFDALVPDRNGDTQKVQSVVQMVNTFLSEMTKLEDSGEDVVIVGATNFLDGVDTAVKSDHRFGEKIRVGNPGKMQRIRLLQHYLERFPTALGEMPWRKVGEVTEGLSAADMESIAKEAGYAACDEVQVPFTGDPEEVVPVRREHLYNAISEAMKDDDEV